MFNYIQKLFVQVTSVRLRKKSRRSLGRRNVSGQAVEFLEDRILLSSVSAGILSAATQQTDVKVVSVPLKNLPGSGTQFVDLTFALTAGHSSFRELGVYAMDDSTGRVNGVRPDAEGFSAAVMESPSRKILFNNGDALSSAHTLRFAANARLAVYVIGMPGIPMRTGADHLRVVGSGKNSASISWEQQTSVWPGLGQPKYDDALIVLNHTDPFTINSAPVIQTIGNKSIDEQKRFTFPVRVTDRDLPNDLLEYSLIAAPSGARIDARTGVFTWTPGEAEGPSAINVTVQVSDKLGLSDTESFQINVREVNRSPVMARIPSQTIDELTQMTVAVGATDPDLPRNTLTYSLVNAPAGAKIDARTGIVRWTPTEAQGPGTFRMTVRVSDGHGLADSETLNVTVREVNRSPLIAPIPPKTVNEQSLLTVAVKAADPDLNKNTLTYSLVDAPASARIDSRTGIFRWTPSEAQGPGVFDVTVRVSDGKGLADTETFRVTVKEINRPPLIATITPKTVNEQTQLTVAVKATDPDLPANTLTYSLVTAPVGARIDSKTGVFRWTPTETQGPGVFNVTVRVTDGKGGSDTETFRVTVREVNRQPLIAAITPRTINEMSPLTVAVKAVNPDAPASTLTYSLAFAPSGAKIDPRTGVFRWTPGEAQGPGVFDVTVRAVSTNGLSDTETFRITVIEVNRPPVLATIPAKTINEQSLLTFTAIATDPDLPKNTLTYSLVSAPAGATIHPTTGVFRWTPTEAQGTGVFNVGVRVSDSKGATDTETVRITVNEVNRPPVLTAIPAKSINELTLLTFTARATDPDLRKNTLTYSLVNAPAGATIHPTTGVFRWTPSEAQGTGVFNVGVRVADGKGATDTETVRITVNEVNRPPVLTATPAKTINELSLLTFTAKATDPDLLKNPLTYSLVNAPVGATIHPTTGVFRWTPTEAQGAGVFNVGVRVSDGKGANDTETVRITVNEVNRPPVLAAILAKTINELSLLTFTAKATDPDLLKNTLTYSLSNAPAGATIHPTTGVFRWTPTEAQGTGVFNVGVRVSDGKGASDTETVRITVNEVNRPPVLATIPAKTINELSLLTFTAKATDPDLLKNTLTYSLVNAPAGATIHPSTGVFRWTPTEAQGTGVFNVGVRVSDGKGATDTETVRITVNEVNRPPVLAAIPAKSVNELSLLTFTARATDPDLPGNTLTYSLVNPPVGATIHPTTGVFRWTPNETQGPGVFNVGVRVSDGKGGTDTETVRITVSEVNLSPLISTISAKTVNELSLLTFTVSATDPDLPANALTFSLINAPAGATIHATSGVFRWTPTETQGPGSFNITVLVSDGKGKTDAKTFKVTVNEVNTRPVLQAISDRQAEVGELLTFTTTATDSDRPDNTLTYSLAAGAPSGARIDARTGVFSWTPTAAFADKTVSVTALVTDNGSPALSASRTFQIVVRDCVFDNQLTNWRVTETGGSPADHGTVVAQDCIATMTEGDSFTTTLSTSFIVPDNATSLSFTYANLNFDLTDRAFINDAFEVSLVDQDGDSLVPTYAANRDAFFNVTEGLPVAKGTGVTVNGTTITVNLTEVLAGSQARMIFRLANNDSDELTTVQITDFAVSPDVAFIRPAATALAGFRSAGVVTPGVQSSNFSPSSSQVPGTTNSTSPRPLLNPNNSPLTSNGTVAPTTHLPEVNDLNAAVYWEKTQFSDFPDSTQVISTPVVIDLNQDGSSEIVFATYANYSGFYEFSGSILRAVSGVDGSELWSTPGVFAGGGIAAADIDRDGFPEIITVAEDLYSLVAFKHDGTKIWKSDASANLIGYGAPSIADLNGDGNTEIIVGATVYDVHGKLLWNGTQNGGLGIGTNRWFGSGEDWGPLSIVADVNLDGSQEVIAGRTIYRADGTILRELNAPDGFDAVGNFDSDPFPEIVLVANGWVYLFDHDSAQPVWESAIPGGGTGGAPTIADFDGSGLPAIGVAGRTAYSVIGGDGAIRWSSATQDQSSHITGSSVFDFDGDGIAEVVYGDELFLRILDGRNGDERFRLPKSSITGYELPVIADVNGDGTAEIVVGANSWPGIGTDDGLWVIGGENANPWENTRPLWNQHSYHISNINDDGTIPSVEANSWEVYNNYRRNLQTTGTQLGKPQITASATESSVPAGTSLLLSGLATAQGVRSNGDRNSISLVTINGEPVHVLDAAGNFFSSMIVRQGQNKFRFVATDSAGQTAEVTLTITGTTATTGIDLSRFADTTGSFTGVYGRTSFEADTNKLYVDLATRNDGTFTSDVPLLVGVRNISDPLVSVIGANGTLPDGTPYFDFTQFVSGGKLGPGQLSGSPTISFHNPTRGQFDYDLVFLGKLNEAPEITTVPRIEAIAGKTYRYDLDARDADSDVLAYSLTNAPAGMQINATTGLITWTTTSANIGQHDVTVKVTDGRGGSATQRFTLQVIIAPPNRPPVITSSPVTSAHLGSTIGGRVVVANDEWITTDLGFSVAPDTTRFVKNVARFFTNGRPGKFLAYADNHGYTGAQIAAALRDDGHEWTVSTSVPFTLEQLQQYDGVFVGGIPADNEVLTQYVKSGGNVYLLGGSWQPTQLAVDEAAAWNNFLGEFGLAFDTHYRTTGVVPIDANPHQLFSGVSTLYQDLGLPIIDLDLNDDSGFLIKSNGGDGLFAISDHRFAAQDGTAYRYQVTASDPEDDPLAYRIAAAPSGMWIDEKTGLIRWTPTSDQVGDHQVKVLVEDGNSGIAEQTFTVCVHPVEGNHAPVIVSQPVITVNRSVTSANGLDNYQYDVDAVDADSDTLEYTLTQSPAGMTIDKSTGVINWPSTNILPPDLQSRILTGPIRNPANGHDYYLLESLRWTDAESDAVKLGGHLATVRNLAENDFIYSNFSKFGGVNRGLWIGLNDVETEGTFKWTSGEESSYINWGASEPVNQNGTDDYVHLFWPGDGREPGWNDQFNENLGTIPISGVVEVINGAEITVRVTDGRGGEDEQSFSVNRGNHDGEIRGIKWDDVNADGIRNDLIASGTTFFGPSPYLQRADSPFNSLFGQEKFWLEDFEDGLLNTPGVTAESEVELIVIGNHIYADSVDADDGLIDASGTSGYVVGPRFNDVGSSALGITFTFDASILGGLPSVAGVVWTDGTPGDTIVLEAFRTDGTSLGTLRGDGIGDGAFDGGTAEDRFFGVSSTEGIAKLSIHGIATGQNAFEVDHLQYGLIGATTDRTEFNASDDFSSVLNPNGQWVSGWQPLASLGSNFTPFNGGFDQFGPQIPGWSASGSHPLVYFNPDSTTFTSPADNIFLLPRQLVLHPGAGGQFAIQRFIAPSDGLYSVESAFDSVDGDHGGTDVHVLVNGVPVFDGIVTTSSVNFSRNSIALSAGDTIDFAVGYGPNADFRHDSTALNAKVVRQLTKEPGLSNWPIYIDLNNNAERDRNEPTTFTNTNGDYVFSGLTQGTYIVREDSRTGWQQTFPSVAAPSHGSHSVTISAGQVVPNINFGNTFTGAPGNGKPVFSSTPVTNAARNQLYRYDAVATDPNSDPLTYGIVSGPEGMTVHPKLGAVVWVPSIDQVGSHSVVISVRDDKGEVALQQFTIEVLQSNATPSITSTAPVTGAVDNAFVYEVQAQDADGDSLTFALDTKPTGMNIDPATGRIAWTPASNQAGNQNVVVDVSDGRGGRSTQAFTVAVAAVGTNSAPVFTSTPRPRAFAGHLYGYAPVATDANGDGLTYSLVSGPAGLILNSNNLLEWTPTFAQAAAKTHAVSIKVSDGKGGEATQTFDITVGTEIINDPPVITSNPRLVAIENQTYVYDLKAFDADADPLLWSLELGPAGMSIDPVLGTLRWTPQDDQMGANSVVVTVTDLALQKSTQRFVIDVRCSNQGPAILSIPLTSAIADRVYLYPVRAVDPEQDVLLYDLTSSPAGMSINPVTGVIRWNPATTQIGLHDIVITATDSSGAVGRQLYKIKVSSPTDKLDPNDPDSPPIGNRPPLITSTPVFSAEVEAVYEYPVTAVDPDGDDIRFSAALMPSGMTIDATTGVIRWTPTAAQAGEYTLIITVTDSNNAVATQGFILVAAVNQPPVITSQPVRTLTAGAQYRYSVKATDPEGDALSYSLDNAPSGMSIDRFGRILWQSAASNTAPQAVTVRVSDSRGKSVTQSFTITMTADTEAPKVSLLIRSGNFTFTGDGQVNVNTSYTVTVLATDNVGIAEVGLLVDGQRVVLNSANSITLTASQLRNVQLEGMAKDTTGLEGKANATVAVVDAATTNEPVPETPGLPQHPGLDPNDNGRPIVRITSPEMSATVTSRTPIIGSVDDPENNLWYYRVYAARIDRVSISDFNFRDSDWTILNTGTQEVSNGPLGVFDPSGLGNDPYVIAVAAYDGNAQGWIEAIIVSVEGNVQVGNFRLEFTDLNIPLAGIPIQVTRVYDTFASQDEGDFGFGWSLATQDARLLEVANLGTGGAFNLGDDKFVPGRSKVFLTNPEGRRVGFTYQERLISFGWFGGVWEPYFVPDRGVFDQLTIDETEVARGGIVGALSQGINPEFYTLTTKSGLKYRYSDVAGLQTITDTNGNQVTFTDDGIFHSAGPSVRYLRDNKGRITQIQDPANNAIQYKYDLNGDLVKVIDRVFANTEFLYLSTPAHYLETYIDQLGRKAAKNEYDANGRLIATITSDGKRITFEHNLDARSEVIYDLMGHPTTYFYDSRGNVTRLVNAVGDVTQYTYDSNDNRLTETNGEGETVTMTYDVGGNMLSRTDNLGNVTRYSYESNRVTTVVDPKGGIYAFTYDDQGNVLTDSDANGNTRYFTYFPNGKVKSSSDRMGNVTAFEYDSRGNIIIQIDPMGHRTKYSYDLLGNRTLTTRTRTDENGDLKTLTTATEYDDGGRVTLVRDVMGNESKFVYRADGLVAEETDIRGIRAVHQYDARGNRTQTAYSDGSSETSTFDANGNVVMRRERNGAITQNEYDDANRVKMTIDQYGRKTLVDYDMAGRQKTIDAAGVTAQLSYDGGQVFSVMPGGNSPDNRQSRVSTVDIADADYIVNLDYDANGNIAEVVASDGKQLSTVYTGTNLPALVSSGGQSLGHYTLDENGDPRQVMDPNGVMYLYSRDSAGRITEITDPFGNKTRFTYDELGNKLSQVDAENRTTRWQYNDAGNVTSRILPGGESESFEYDSVGNLKTHTHFSGDRTEYEHDLLGRVTRKFSVSDGRLFEFEYESSGRLKQVRDSRGVTTFGYDAFGRTTKIQNPDESFIEYQYDDHGNRTKIRTKSGTVQYTYDSLNRISTVLDIDGAVTRYDYDMIARSTTITRSNGTKSTYVSDAQDRPISVIHQDATGVLSAKYDVTYETLNSRERTIRELDGRIVVYTYDALHRLVQESINDPGAENKTIKYTYDRAGNRLSKIESGQTTSYTYNANHQLISAGSTSYSYDENGNLKRIVDAADITEYMFNSDNQLVHVALPDGTLIDYEYDHAGIRVSESEDGQRTVFLVDRESVVSRVIEAEKMSSATVRRFLYGDRLLAEIRSGESFAVYQDPLSSIRFVAGQDGTFVSSGAFDAFGVRLDSGSDNENGFQSEPTDSRTGLMYLRARYYASAVGRLLSIDPFEGSILDPRSINPYSFANNDPTSFFDPTGNFVLASFGLINKLGPAFAAFGGFSSSQFGVVAAVLGGSRPTHSVEATSVSSPATSLGFGAGLSYSASTEILTPLSGSGLPSRFVSVGFSYSYTFGFATPITVSQTTGTAFGVVDQNGSLDPRAYEGGSNEGSLSYFNVVAIDNAVTGLPFVPGQGALTISTGSVSPPILGLQIGFSWRYYRCVPGCG